MTLVDIARLFLFIREREGAQNEGLRVEAIQKWSGGRKGDSWCCYMLCVWLDLFYQGQLPAPLKRTGVCQDVYDVAKAQGWVAELPHVGDIYLYVNEVDHAHHIGLVTDVTADGFRGISGNTSEDGLSSNGDRVAERQLKLKPTTKFVRLPA